MAFPSPPTWVVFGRVAILDEAVDPGDDVAFTLSSAPRVSFLTIPPRLLPEAITHRDPNNPSIVAVDPSGGLLLVHVIIRRASVSQPVIVNRPGHARYALSTGFFASYLLVDTTAKTAHPLPHPGIIKDPARIGILHHPMVADRYIVAEIQFVQDRSDMILLSFDSHEGQWLRESVPFPISPVHFNPECVISHNRRLWWVDLSFGLIVWDPITELPLPALKFVKLPFGKAFERTDVCDLCKHRCVSVSDGKLRFVDMDCNNRDIYGMRKVSVWTLLEADQNNISNSNEWFLEYEAKIQTIWQDGSYKNKRLPKRMPVLAFIHPKNHRIVYFFLDKHLFGIDFQGQNPIVVDCHEYQPIAPSSDRISSRCFHAWDRDLQHPSAFLDSKAEGNACGVDPDFLQGEYIYRDELFSALYGENLRGGTTNVVNKFSGVNGQTFACASEAIKHWNKAHDTLYEIDMTEPMDSNAFNGKRSRRFGVERSYFHCNFYAKSLTGTKDKQLFFAELSGLGGPDSTSIVIPLGQDEEAIKESSGEHICQCCTGLMHPYSTEFLGCEATATHHKSTST